MQTVTFRCFTCGRMYSRDEVRYLCPQCAATHTSGQPLDGVLETLFDYDFISKNIDPAHPDWSLLSPVESRYYPAYSVGNTPMVRGDRLGETLGVAALWIKNDGLNPSGSLKDRASFLMVAEANRLNEDTIVTASTGNAASALAAVCAAAGKQAVIYVPRSAPKGKLAQMKLCAASVIEVDGTYDDAFSLSLAHTEKQGGLNRNTAYHPLTIEGKKTVALEMYTDLNRSAPDTVIVPVGDGVILSGVYKGFFDLLQVGLIDKMPRLVCVQAAGSDAIAQLIATGRYRSTERPETVADSISVSTPSNAWMARRAVDDTNGFSITVTDEEIFAGMRQLAQFSGIFAEPAAAAGVAGLSKAVAQGRIFEGNTVLLITGHGLKDVASMAEAAQSS